MTKFFKVSKELKAQLVKSIGYHKKENMISIKYRKKTEYLPVYKDDIKQTLAKFDFIYMHKMNSKTVEGCKAVIVENWWYIEDSNSKNERPGESNGIDQLKVIEEASEEIMKSYRFVAIEETSQIWYYDKGVYVSGGDILIEKEAEKIFGYDVNSSRLSEIKGHIMRRTYHKREELDADLNIMNLKNGLYDVDNDVLKPHSPDYLTINQKPIIYIKDSKAQRFEQFLSEVLFERDIRTGIEAMAYTFEREYSIEVIFFLLGLGANGKTVFTSVITALHGKDNVSNVPLSEMIKDRFALSDLENKDLNIDNELGNQTIRDTAILKRLTGGFRQPIRIQRKNQRAYDTTLYAKLFFNANKMPDSEDESDAYYRRIIEISFPHKFEGDKEDRQLIPKLTTEKEKSGIFNILMNALRQIRLNKEIYVNEKTIEDKRLKYLRAHDSVKGFLQEAIDWEKSKEDDYVSKEELHIAYRSYCSKHRLPAEKYDTFCKRVKNTRIEKEMDDTMVSVLIFDARKHIGDEDDKGNPKKTPIWNSIILSADYENERLEAKKDKMRKTGQESLDLSKI